LQFSADFFVCGFSNSSAEAVSVMRQLLARF
jgi:hypothetical protein